MTRKTRQRRIPTERRARTSQTARTRPLDAAYLGIDWGTTSLRARLFIPSNNRTVEVGSATFNQRFGDGEYSSAIYPTEPREPIYNGNVIIPERYQLSAKVSVPPLIGTSSDSEIHQYGYELVQRHFDKLKDADTRKRALTGIEGLFREVYRDVQNRCRENDLFIAAIVLAIPAHWTLEYEELYKGVIEATFTEYDGDIFFVTEAEAIARYLYQNERQILAPSQDDGDGTVVLIMDFGGHNMNGCLINIAASDDRDGDPGFFLLAKAEDAGGGSEQWERYIAEECIQLMIREGLIPNDDSTSPQQNQMLLDDFNKFKKENCGKTNADFKFHYLAPDGRTEPLSLSFSKVAEAHNQAFDFALHKADVMMEEATDISNGTARVIVTGGSVRCEFTRGNVEQLSQKHNISKDKLCFPHQKGVHKPTMMIACGAAFAAAYQVSVSQFIDRGAAFGMQIKPVQIGSSRAGSQTALWRSRTEKTLFSGGETRNSDHRFSSNGRSEYKIICHPFFKGDASDFLPHRRCYDFLELGALRKGYWTFDFDIHRTDGGMTLRLKGRRISHKGGYIDIDKTWEYPLYMSIGENAVHLGNANSTSEEIFGQLWKDIRASGKEPAKTHGQDFQEAPRLIVPAEEVVGSPTVSLSPPHYSRGTIPRSSAPPALCLTQKIIPGEPEQTPSSNQITTVKDNITVSSRGDPNSVRWTESYGSSFTSINQTQRLQEFGRRGLHQMNLAGGAAMGELSNK
ncbi:hypothetical protein F5Y16DRAFT_422803 [Xylariaceae sp. FL0255]|nr:hypothetical protein F5Y16DRAFT_422803 [Xylariaceae sp. FL0255]